MKKLLSLLLVLATASACAGAPVRPGPGPDERFTVAGANRAKGILVRAVLRSRHDLDGATVWDPGSMYGAYYFLRDVYMAAAPLEGYFDAATLRAALVPYFDSIGGDPVGPAQAAQHFILHGKTPQYREGANNTGHRPTYDSAAYMILTAGLVYRRGDPTIFNARKAALQAMFEETPRAPSGLLYSDPAERNCGWGFESGNYVYGELGMASALYAQAAREMIYMATEQGDAATVATFKAHYQALVKGLATLRRPDGLYRPSRDIDRRHAMLSALMVAEGLIADPVERRRTALELRAGVLSSQFLSTTGAMRHLYADEFFPGAGNPPGATQNGGYWHGQWVGWLARAMVVAGDRPLGHRVMQTAVDALNTIHDQTGSAPWEIQNADGTAHAYNNLYSMAAGGFLEVADDPQPAGRFMLVTRADGVTAATPSGFTVEAGGTSGVLSEESLAGLSGTVVLRDPTGATVSTLSTTAPLIVPAR